MDPSHASPTPVLVPDLLRRAGEIVARRGRVALAQIVRVEGSTAGKTGWKLLVGPDGEVEGNLGGGAFEAMVIADARARLGPPQTAGPSPRPGRPPVRSSATT